MLSRRLLVAAPLALLAALFLWPSLALAHTSVIRANPPDLCPNREQAYLLDPDPRCASGEILAAPPDSIRITFSEPVRPVGGGITITGPSGAPVELAAATVDNTSLSVPFAATEQGTYLVTWRVVSYDTHPAWGRYAFSVGRASPLPGVDIQQASFVSQVGLALQATGHWLHIIGYALAFGTLAFMLFVLRAFPFPTRLWRLVNVGLLLLLLSEVPGLFGQMAGLGTGEFFSLDLLTALMTSSYGLVLAQRSGAAIVLWVLLGVAGPGGEASGLRWLPACLLPGVAIAVIDGEASHAVTVDPLLLGLLLNAVHVMAMGLWVGGLAALLSLGKQERTGLLRHFGLISAGAVLALALSGTLMAGLHVESPERLLDSGYGRTLALKLGLVLLALALAGLGLRAAMRLRWRLRAIELGVLSLILLLAATLITLPPPR